MIIISVAFFHYQKWITCGDTSENLESSGTKIVMNGSICASSVALESGAGVGPSCSGPTIFPFKKITTKTNDYRSSKVSSLTDFM